MPDPERKDPESMYGNYNDVVRHYRDEGYPGFTEQEYNDELKARVPEFDPNKEDAEYTPETRDMIDGAIEGMVEAGPDMSPAQQRWNAFKASDAAQGQPSPFEPSANQLQSIMGRIGSRDIAPTTAPPTAAAPAATGTHPPQPATAPAWDDVNAVMKKFINATYGVDADQNPQRELQFANAFQADKQANPDFHKQPHVTELPVQHIVGDPGPRQPHVIEMPTQHIEGDPGAGPGLYEKPKNKLGGMLGPSGK